MHRWQCGHTFDGSSASRHHTAANRSKVVAQYAQTTGWGDVGTLSFRPRFVIGVNDREIEGFSLILGSAQPRLNRCRARTKRSTLDGVLAAASSTSARLT